MTRRNLITAMLLLLTTAIIADEYTDPLTGVVYIYEKGSGVAKVKEGVYHAWDSRTRSASQEKEIVVLDSFKVDGCEYAVNEIGNYAFYYTDAVTIKIPPTVKRIGDYVFQGNYNLRAASLPDSLKSLGVFAFSRCDQLTTISLPDQMTVIPRGTFHTCRSLCEITLPESLVEIGEMSFICCSNLHEIVIPKQVTTIGMGAFEECGIATIISQIEEPGDIDINAFGDETYENATLYVPTGSKSKYEATTGWSRFKTIIEGSPTAIQSIRQRNFEEPAYDLQGHRLNGSRQKGIYIHDGKKRVAR
jgi:hypothetical protein